MKRVENFVQVSVKDLVVGIEYYLDGDAELTGNFIRFTERNTAEFLPNMDVEQFDYELNSEGNIEFIIGGLPYWIV